MRHFGLCAALLLSTVDPTGIATRPAYAQQPVRTVVVTGLGKDARSALQNAAENALTQVSGTFVRTDTTIERTSEIRGAIRVDSLRIDNRMSEYAQGTISSIQILSSSQEGLTTRVEARVSVRVSELKAFIESIDVGTAPIGAEVAINSALALRRTASAENIFLDTVFRPIVMGTALDFKIGTALPVKTFMRLSKRYDDFDISRAQSNYIVFPITAEIRSDFLTNIQPTLKLISGAKSNSAFSPFTFYLNHKNRISSYDFIDMSSNDTFPSRSLKARERWKHYITSPSGSGANENEDGIIGNPQFAEIKFKDANEKVVHKLSFYKCGSHRDIMSPTSDIFLFGYAPPNSGGSDPVRCFIPVWKERRSISAFSRWNFYLFVDPSSDWFSAATSLTIEIRNADAWD